MGMSGPLMIEVAKWMCMALTEIEEELDARGRSRRHHVTERDWRKWRGHVYRDAGGTPCEDAFSRTGGGARWGLLWGPTEPTRTGYVTVQESIEMDGLPAPPSSCVLHVPL